MMEEKNIVVFHSGKRTEKMDFVATESVFKIFINEREFFTCLCSPKNLEFLAMGMIFTSGLLEKSNAIKSLSVKENRCYVETEKPVLYERHMFYPAQPDVFLREDKNFAAKISSKKILKLMKDFRSFASIYRNTGAVHCAGISDGEKIIFFHEDISRYNAIDKVIGECISKGFSTHGKIILTSGRINSGIVLKSAVAGVSVIISNTAPTSYGIELAELYNITAVGFVRGMRMNVYTHYWRIT